MNFTTVDWIVVAIFLIILVFGGSICRNYAKGVADYFVAGRKMRKYLGLSTLTAESLGLISIALMCQEGFTKGFSYIWLCIAGATTQIIVFGILGFAIMRYRDTKVMTIAQYFEIRYNKRIRILTGFVIAFSGVLNMALFPIVESKFLIDFIGFPLSMTFGGITIPTTIPIMTLLIFVALFFAYLGGMVTVIVTDFIQSIVIAFAVIIASYFIVVQTGWITIHNSLQTNLGAAGYNPLATGSYGIYWMLACVLGNIIGFVSFSPQMQKISSADSAKTAKQMTLYSLIFLQGRMVLLLGWGMVALAVLGAVGPHGESAEVWSRMATPVFMGKSLPAILKGIAVAGFLAASISTNATYFLTWGSTITNDLICTNLKKTLSPQAHIKLFRVVVAGVGLFLWVFGVFYKPTESILAFLGFTGVMFHGVGIALIGGLYWKRGTIVGGYAAVILSCILPTLDLLFRRVFEGVYNPNPGNIMFGIDCISIVAYITISLLTYRKEKINV